MYIAYVYLILEKTLSLGRTLKALSVTYFTCYFYIFYPFYKFLYFFIFDFFSGDSHLKNERIIN